MNVLTSAIKLRTNCSTREAYAITSYLNENFPIPAYCGNRFYDGQIKKAIAGYRGLTT